MSRRGHVPRVPPDSRIHFKEERATITGINLHIEVREATIVSCFKNTSRILPQLGKRLGNHCNGITDHGWRMIFQEDSCGTNQSHMPVRVDIGGH